VGPRRFEIHIDYVGQTVDLVTTISEGVVTVTGNASFLAEGTVVRRLKRDMPSLLRRCEELAAAGENNSSPKNQRA
jgi:hypothetical protein